MNKDGKLCDVTGNILGVGNQVRIVEGYACCKDGHGIGTVMVLHESGDWTGYASVRWRDGGRGCSVPDKALKIVARKASKLDPVELQAFALFLWTEGKSYTKDDIPEMVAEYIVARSKEQGSAPNNEGRMPVLCGRCGTAMVEVDGEYKCFVTGGRHAS